MTEQALEYKSDQKTVNIETNVLETIDKDGIVCTWTGNTANSLFAKVKTASFTWQFDWSQLKDQGIDRLKGFIKVKIANHHKIININSKEAIFSVSGDVQYSTVPVNASFEYHLTTNYDKNEEISYEEMFAASGKTDAILVVEGKKLNVNKAFLSFHSDFFIALFSSNFKEGQLTEIPIEEVTYVDFGLLMSIIYPENVFPNDKTAEKLLELADRFLMPFVIRIVEYHLLRDSEISNEKLIRMADAYKMPKLLEKCVESMDTVEKIKALQQSEEYGKLSSETCKKLLDRLVQLV